MSDRFPASISRYRVTAVGRQLPTVNVGYPAGQLGVGFPAVRSLTLLSLADPLLSVASTASMSAVQRLLSVVASR